MPRERTQSKQGGYTHIGHRNVAHQTVVLVHDGDARDAVLAHPSQRIQHRCIRYAQLRSVAHSDYW